MLLPNIAYIYMLNNIYIYIFIFTFYNVMILNNTFRKRPAQYTTKFDKWQNDYDMGIMRVMNKSWFYELVMPNIQLWDDVSNVNMI